MPTPEDEGMTGAGWRLDDEASRARLREIAAGGPAARAEGGKLLYTDEHGRQRRLPADRGQLTGEEIAAAADALSSALGAPEPSYAQIAALERLNELRTAGAVGAEDYEREKRRILKRR